MTRILRPDLTKPAAKARIPYGATPELVKEFGLPVPVLSIEHSGSKERRDGSWGPAKRLVSEWVADDE